MEKRKLNKLRRNYDEENNESQGQFSTGKYERFGKGNFNFGKDRGGIRESEQGETGVREQITGRVEPVETGESGTTDELGIEKPRADEPNSSKQLESYTGSDETNIGRIKEELGRDRENEKGNKPNRFTPI